MKTQTLSFDLNLVDLSVSGYWFCNGCNKITEPAEDQHGMNKCRLCESHRIRWNPPVFENEIKGSPLAESCRLRLDNACNACQEALRLCVSCPDKENFDALTRAIAFAHGALSDLSECERKLRDEAYKAT
jgi:hypothetical protein